MKRKTRTAKPRKDHGAAKKSRRKTGAPTAHFLSALNLGKALHPVLIEGSREQRESLAGLSTDEIYERIWYALVELSARVARPHVTSRGLLDDAANTLAVVAVSAANLLHSLAFSDDFLEWDAIRWAARRKPEWPVLLSLGIKQNSKGQRSTVLKGRDRALAYLSSIELGQQADSPLQHFGNRDASVFKKAAELLLNDLRRWCERGAWREKVTPWGKKLLLLGWPMTTENVADWWNVAKQWMDETWEISPQLFEPLIRECRVKGKPLSQAGLFSSEVRSRIIDLRLKEAFESLARPAVL